VADEMLAERALNEGPACLVSWWRHPRSRNESGTSCAWLSTLPREVVEVHCVCAIETAIARFAGRQRHPGHLDSSRSREALRGQFEESAQLGALGIGTVIQVATDADVAIEPILSFITSTSSVAPRPSA
jgi:hypothetical protein